MSKYNINEIIQAKVNSIKSYGIFVIVDDVYTGLIHISQINGKYINDIHDYFKIGDIIKVRIIDIDEEKKQLKLSTVNINKNGKENLKLPDTALGFELFEEILPEWIDEKLEEIEKNK
ncbi:MAG: S1 RNA-binding domain-containing protein [Bacilli bacterium]|nr:S1 RNA-binding domain-containing protein [Bacilli bacterium]